MGHTGIGQRCRIRIGALRRTAHGGLAVLAAAMLTMPGFAQDGPRPASSGVVLQALDKVTATMTTLNVPLERLFRFGTLEITVRACHSSLPTEPPEHIAFLEIDETNPEVDERRVYSGWMFASSPALAALEHPVFDVWVIDCMTAETVSGDSTP